MVTSLTVPLFCRQGAQWAVAVAKRKPELKVCFDIYHNCLCLSKYEPLKNLISTVVHRNKVKNTRNSLPPHGMNEMKRKHIMHNTNFIRTNNGCVSTTYVDKGRAGKKIVNRSESQWDVDKSTCAKCTTKKTPTHPTNESSRGLNQNCCPFCA